MSAHDLKARKEEYDYALRYLASRDLAAVRGNLTQKEIASTAQVPQAYVSTVESGKAYGIGRDALVRLAKVYETLES